MSCGMSLPVAVPQDARAGCDGEPSRFTGDSSQESPARPPPWRDGHRMGIANPRVRTKGTDPIDERHAVS
jgi:hypothetical protein